jgi:SAM-dependent methyltransferase
MATTKTPQETAAGYDLAHEAASHPLLRRLWAEAFGADYPAEVDPFSSCTWWTLGQLVAGLRLGPGSTLVDLGCGRGGIGLWLARALSCSLVGVDISPMGISSASRRAADFVPAGQATFRVGTFDATGLPDGCADGVVSVDALPFAPDRAAAFAEVRRLLRPGGRLVFTAAEDTASPERPNALESWEPLLVEAGLAQVSRLPVDGWLDRWLGLYALLLAHEDELRAAIGGPIEGLLREARDGERLRRRTPVLLVAAA